ncbi:MAG: AsmA family protein [Candidatus Longimicrobiales bacterium M2_2A_002]
MNRRRILLIAAAGLALLVGAVVLTVVLIPEQRVADAVATRAESALGQPVAIDGVGLVLFPLPGVRLSGVAIGPDTAELARIDRAEVRIRLLPLLGGRVVVRSVALDAPRIAVEIDREGVSNFPVIESDTSGEPSTRDITFEVDRIRISDGGIRYINHQDSTRVVLDGWEQELSVTGVLDRGELSSLALAGWIAFDDIEADLPGVVLPPRDLSVRVEHDASLDLRADRLDLRELGVDVEGVMVRGSGRVEGVNSGRPFVDLELAAEGIDADRLMAWVPDSLRARLALPDGRAVGLQGTASLRAAVNGTVAPDTLPSVDGSLTLADGAVTVGSDALLESVSGDVTFSLDSVVARFDGRALGESFNAGVAVRDPASPLAVVALSGRADLGRLAGLGLVSDTLGLGGDVRVDVRAQLPLRDPAGARARGTIDATSIAMTGLEPEIRVPNATAQLDGGRVRANPFRIELGPDRTAIDLDVSADGWIPAVVDSTAPPPQVAVAMEADSLDLDALLGPSESGYPPLLFARLRDRRIDGRPVEDVARDMGLRVPRLPPVEATVTARIGTLVRNGLRYTDMTADALVTPRAITVREIRFGLMGGTVDVSAEVEPTETNSAGMPVQTRIAGRFGVTRVGAAPFFDQLTPFRNHLSGRLDLAGTVGLTLDRFALPVRESVGAGGTIAISEGRVANWAVLQGVTEKLGIAVFDTLRFRDWAAGFRIDGPRVTLDETAIDGSRLDAVADGWFDFGGMLNVEATALLTEELARQAGAIGQQLLAATSGDRVPVGLLISGDVESPDVSLDLSPVREALAGRAREAVQEVSGEVEQRARAAAGEAEEAVRGAAEQALGGVRDRATQQAGRSVTLPDSLRGLPADSLREILGDSAYALLPDSVRLRADSLQQSLENALRNRLRRLLPGGGGGGGDDEPDSVSLDTGRLLRRY